SVSNDPIAPVYEEACRILSSESAPRWDCVRVISVPLLPLKQERPDGQDAPYTGLLDVALRARQVERFQDMLLDKSLIDRVNRVRGGSPVTVLKEPDRKETFFPIKIRLVTPHRPQDLSLRMMEACSVAERRDLINTAVADGSRAIIERL